MSVKKSGDISVYMAIKPLNIKKHYHNLFNILPPFWPKSQYFPKVFLLL